MDILRSYRRGVPRWWQLFSDQQVAVVVAAIVLGIWTGRPLPVVGVATTVFLIGGWRRVARVALVGGLLGCTLADRAWSEVHPDRLGPYEGWACLITDPAPISGAIAAVFEIEGERFEAWTRGAPKRKIAEHLAGECAWIQSERREFDPRSAQRGAIRHIVGRVVIESVGDWSDGTPMARASNRVRRLFSIGAGTIANPYDSLFAGLVIGDDRFEPPQMIVEFRSAGLSHLTAVSGSNVAFVLAAASPLLRRLRPVARWVATIAVIAWFVALTRFEPSILRAGVMAAIACTGYLLGREKPPGRVLALAVGLLVLVDPLLVWSVGFWLSVAATGGVALLGGRLAAIIPGPRWLAIPLGVTLGAQIAVAPVSLLVFGTLPLVSIPANLLAVPVAGVVMLYGLPAGLVSGSIASSQFLGGLSDIAATAIQLPSSIGTRWVATVAALAAQVEPPAPWSFLGWLLVFAGLLYRALTWRASGALDPFDSDVQGLPGVAAPDHRR
ncbi:MAG: ComEC/Rec2 family competence protein [Ilumatobacteraceae bacterium]